MGVWGATPEPHDIFWQCPFQTTPSLTSKNSPGIRALPQRRGLLPPSGDSDRLQKKENGVWNSILGSVGSLVQKMGQVLQLKFWGLVALTPLFQPHPPLHPKYHCCTVKPQQRMSPSQVLNLTLRPNLTQSQRLATHLHPLLSMCQVVQAYLVWMFASES